MSNKKKTNDDWKQFDPVRSFVMYSVPPESLTELLRRTCNDLDATDGVDVQDIVISQELLADGMPWKVTVYWAPEEV